jgi:hypothetical protein
MQPPDCAVLCLSSSTSAMRPRGKQRTCAAAETLTGRNGGIAMVEVFCDLSQFTILPCRVCDLPVVMMWTDKDQMIGIVEESSACLNLYLGRHLGAINASSSCVSIHRRPPDLMTGLPVSASACSTKARKFGFWTWSRKPAIP